MTSAKKFELSDIFALFKQGKNAKEVAAKFNLSKSNMSYYTAKLKKFKVLRYIGSGIWEVIGDLATVQKSVPTHLPDSSNFIKKNPKKECRGHAFIWKIELEGDIDWKKHLDKSKIKYKVQSSGAVLRIMHMGRKIWLQKNGTMTIYEPLDFFGINAYESKGLAVYNMDKLIKDIFKKIGQQMKRYKFTTARQHFGLIKNELARQFNKEGEKLIIKTEDGTEWLWIDDSKGLGEFEVGNLVDSPKISVLSQKWWNDHRKTNFQVSPSMILEGFNKASEIAVESAKQIREVSKQVKGTEDKLEYYADNQVSHVGLMNRIADKIDNMDAREERLISAIESISKK